MIDASNAIPLQIKLQLWFDSDHRWKDFQSIKTLITEKLNNLFIIILSKSDLTKLFNILSKTFKYFFKIFFSFFKTDTLQ